MKKFTNAIICAAMFSMSFGGLADEYRARTDSEYQRKNSLTRNAIDIGIGTALYLPLSLLADSYNKLANKDDAALTTKLIYKAVDFGSKAAISMFAIFN